MKKFFRIQSLLTMGLFVSMSLHAQKKELDHSVYDGWQSVGASSLSNDGKWIVYNVNVQEGDNELVIQSVDGSYKKNIHRGYSASITEDSRYLVFRIKPFYQELREAKIKKKKPEDTPKDTLAVIELGKEEIWKKANVKNFKTPEKGVDWLAYHLDKEKAAPTPPKPKKDPVVDSLKSVIDSLQAIINTPPPAANKKKKNRDDDTFDSLENFLFAEGDEPAPAGPVGTTLVLRQLTSGTETKFMNVLKYGFDESGKKLYIEQSREAKDSLSKAAVVIYTIATAKADTILYGGNEFKAFQFSEDGKQLAFIAEREAKAKDLIKTYKLWHYQEGKDSAQLLVDNATTGLPNNYTVSPYANISFSKSGKRLFFDTAPIPAPKDTTLVDIDLVKLDVWHYNEDYLQTVQLNRVNRTKEEDFQAVYDLEKGKMVQLADVERPSIYLTQEGDGELAVAVTDFGKRVESQWTGSTKKDVYLVNTNDGSKKLLLKNLNGSLSPSYISPSSKYIVWYNYDNKAYQAYNGASIVTISKNYKYPLWNELHDSPSDPNPYGFMGWDEKEEFIYVYDRYGIVKLFLNGTTAPEVFTTGRNTKTQYRYVRTDREEKFISRSQDLLMKEFNEVNKSVGLFIYRPETGKYTTKSILSQSPVSMGAVTKVKGKEVYAFTKESYVNSPNVYSFVENGANYTATQLSNTNPQQQEYNWGTASLYNWKTFSGKTSTGILYKPENFDSTKTYPIIFYFYETLSDGLHTYNAPAPTPSRLNISFFVSRGYLVFAPDIRYTIGHPAKSAYDYIVSAAKDLAKHKWVDGKNMGIQGQSWGGIQVAQLITMTDIFKAAWSGAPVANMTSAYGGIRWGTGLTRQFQYEKQQSRIGATLWEKPELYIENSPLFHLPKVKTPIVIMHNDQDGAVPWYQGIELFTGLRRLGKQAWMLNYNGEDHNLVERKNRKDIQIREQQFFDWLLKGAKPARWLVEGIPAVEKGKTWGLELVD